MKAYIGNKMVCLAQPEEREDQDGYEVLYPDGSETWLVKEIFDFEFRRLDDEEIQMVMSTIIDTDLSEEQMKTLLDLDFDSDSFDITDDMDATDTFIESEDSNAG